MIRDKSIRIAHISDLHFSKPSLHPGQFFSKRWLGNLNLLFSRKKDFDTERLQSLANLYQELKVNYLIITGDLSTTSLESEFSEAAEFIEQFKKVGIEVFCLPGNHDHYTKKAFQQKLFYHYFPSNFSPEKTSASLREEGVTLKHLGEGWWLIAIETALATSLISSRGFFSPELEKNLTKILLQLPKDDKVILANHFPLFNNDGPRKALKRASALQEQLQKFPNVKLYLHGHTHRQCIADLRANNLPIVLDSGSASHCERGSWNLIEISPQGCQVQTFQYDLPHLRWQPAKQAAFEWVHG